MTHSGDCPAGIGPFDCVCGARAEQRKASLAAAEFVRKQITGDSVDHPSHYTSHPSGIECIQVTEHMNFNLGNAVKYLWRADDKGDPIENLKKARWYVDREIQRRERQDHAKRFTVMPDLG